ncbi:MAG: ABC transporter [Oscillatoriales cyanobacterium CG2_30_44_21]|nr:MAG: ABC transporter [Oscillatoriales cyanobacterium CG2_30_44_21]
MLAAERIDSRATLSTEEKRRTTTRIAMCVPRRCYGEPIISRLSCEHGLIVNIMAALLGENPKDEGWFTLELSGTTQQIQSGIIYLEELDLEIWDKTTVDDESW